VERALAAELDVHLHEEREQAEAHPGNRRNGKSAKTLQRLREERLPTAPATAPPPA
jgi:hypothetical protein